MKTEIHVDPARFGDESTTIKVYRDEEQLFSASLRHVTLQETGDFLLYLADFYAEVQTMTIDGTGIGAGLVDQMRERWKREAVEEIRRFPQPNRTLTRGSRP